MNQLQALVGPAARQWRRVLAVGAVDVLAGIVALAWPGVTVVALAIVLGVLLLIAGIATIGVGVRTGVIWLTILGVLTLIGAIVCLVHPGAGIYAILIGCAIWFFLNGVADLGAAFGGRSDRLLWGVLGTLSIAASVIMIASPGVAIVTVALIAGISFVARGVAELMLAWRLRAVDRGAIGR